MPRVPLHPRSRTLRGRHPDEGHRVILDLCAGPGGWDEALRLLGRDVAARPVCGTPHALTRDRRLWTHGPRRARCRGSQRTIAGARIAARDTRGGAR